MYGGNPQEEGGLGYWQTFVFFIKNSILDIKKRKCHFALAFSTVFIVVLCTLVINTITSKGPIIFMQLAQEDAGQIDGVIYPKSDGGSKKNSLSPNVDFLNFTRIQQVLVEDINGKPYAISPRNQQNNDLTGPFDSAGRSLAGSQEPKLLFIDAEREHEIGLGVEWPFQNIQYDQCAIY